MELNRPKYKFTAKDLLANSMILTSYVVLTMITYHVSFLSIQFRVAEIMVLLVFFLFCLILLFLVMSSSCLLREENHFFNSIRANQNIEFKW